MFIRNKIVILILLSISLSYTFTACRVKSEKVTGTFSSTEVPIASALIPGTGTATVTTIPSPESKRIYCANPYWPVVEGAVWVYSGTISSPANDQNSPTTGTLLIETPIMETWEIRSIEGDYPYPAEFIVSTGQHFFCDETGIYWLIEDGSKLMLLPPEKFLVLGQTFNSGKIFITSVDERVMVETPLGEKSAWGIFYSPGEGGAKYYFVEGIGIVKYMVGYEFNKELDLVSFSIPLSP